MHVEFVCTSIPLPAGYYENVVVNFHLKKREKKRNFWHVRDVTARDQRDVNHTAGGGADGSVVASV